jgi:tRNA(Ile)-lysidine synthase TilS/MesJ
MNFCTKCVLPDTFPGISFDDNGVCNYCRNIPIPSQQEKQAHLEKFEKLLADKRDKHNFDVLLAYSGGKDSTYTLYMLRKRYNLKVIAFVFDNGFISEQALTNIRTMTDTLGAACIIFRPPFEHMKKAFNLAASKDIYSPKTLDRASSICTTCIGMVKGMMIKTALAYDIPLMAFGWSPGQAPISSAIMQTNPRLQRFSHRTVRDPLITLIGDDMKGYFLRDDDLETDPMRWPVNIHPLAFTEYDEDEILKKIKSLGWVKPEDTDPNSTNCLLNALANYLHKKRFSFHPYAWEIAGIVRSESMVRAEGIAKVTKDEDMEMVGYAARLLDIDL